MRGDLGHRAFAAARGMLGVRFRPQGCDPETGLDCVGLVWAAYACAGRRLTRPAAWPLRGWRAERIHAALADAGFRHAEDDAMAGDVAVVALPAGQFHLALIAGESMVHAHAGLRRVVENPIDAATRIAPRWRLKG